MQAILFVGHGDLPKAMVSSVQMIIGPNPDLFNVCLSSDDGKDEFATKLKGLEDKLESYEKVIVFSDLLGGSPNNVSFEQYYQDDRFEIISGMNLAMALTAALSSSDPNTIIKEGHQGIINVKNPQAEIQEQKESSANMAKVKQGRPYNIKNVRVDSRGIHGQVATAWVPYLEVDRIIVIDDNAIKDETQKIALKMAKPNHVSCRSFRLQKRLSVLKTAILTLMKTSW